MASPFALIRICLRALKRILTGEILRQVDTEIGSGRGIVSLLLKRERRSRNEYIVLVSRVSGVYYYLFELDEFDRFIEAADDIRASQTWAINTSPQAISRLGHFTDMFRKGEVLRRVDTELYAGYLKMSLRLKREQNTPREYVVLATVAPGWWLYYTFELGEFHRFVAAAKAIRAAARSPSLDEQQA